MGGQGSNRRISTGSRGLDAILRGGLSPGRSYLLEGRPGSGKTTLAMQFLLAGVTRGESCLMVTLSEGEAELHATAASHGWRLDGLNVLELRPSEETLARDGRYTMYHPSDVELAETTKAVLAETERLKPTRLVIDSLSELRLLAETPLRYRRQILALTRYFSRAACTVLLLDDRGTDGAEVDSHSLVLQALAHGVISLDVDVPEYGTTRRRLHVGKLRGQAFSEGYHDFTIRRHGLEVFPRLIASEHGTSDGSAELSTGVAALDALLGGGLTAGTSTLLMGAAGTGKSSLAAQIAYANAERGERAAFLLFEEAAETFIARAETLGIPVRSHIDAGRILVRQIDPAELSPGEFAHLVRGAVEQDQVATVVIDSLSGYFNAMPNERFLALHLHELLAYLRARSVTTLLLMAQHGLVGPVGNPPIDASYLADTVLLLRYFEARGEVRQAVSVIKKRTGTHERTIRELRVEARGILIGEPILDFQGVLSGLPEFRGRSAPLATNNHD